MQLVVRFEGEELDDIFSLAPRPVMPLDLALRRDQ
jgi:hypothetical protein